MWWRVLDSCSPEKVLLTKFSVHISDLQDFLNGKKFTDQPNGLSGTWNEQDPNLMEGLDKEQETFILFIS